VLSAGASQTLVFYEVVTSPPPPFSTRLGTGYGGVPLQIKIDKKQVENVEEFNYLGSMITNDARCTREIKARIAMAKAAFNKRNTLFTSKLDLELKKKLVECYIWSIALYGAETWTLKKLGRKYMESFEMWCWRRMERISWTDRVNNEALLHRVKEGRNILHTIRRRNAN
jgi:hypothetical protein